MSTELLPPGTQAALEKDGGRGQLVLRWAEQLELRDHEQATWANDKLKEIKLLLKRAEEQRLSVARPLNEALRALNALAKGVTGPLQQAEATVKRKLDEYLTATEERREQAMHAVAAGDAAALPLTAPEAPLEGLSVRHKWDFEVTEPAAVPRELCSPDPKLIREAIWYADTDTPPRPIPGVRFFRRAIVSARIASATR